MHLIVSKIENVGSVQCCFNTCKATFALQNVYPKYTPEGNLLEQLLSTHGGLQWWVGVEKDEGA